MKEPRSIEEIVRYEVDKIAEGGENAARIFKGKAISIQNKAWDAEYADGRFEVACNVLLIAGCCNRNECDNCTLNSAHNQALIDISSGLRKKPERVRYKKFRYSVPGYIVSVKTNPKTGVVTSVMKPINNAGLDESEE